MKQELSEWNHYSDRSGFIRMSDRFMNLLTKEVFCIIKEESGQILEEGITEAGSISSFIAAGTSYATHGINMIPFFIFIQCSDFRESEILSGQQPTAGQEGFWSAEHQEEQH